MKLYILRHEDRTQDCSFFAPLTKEGLNNAEKLADIINNHKIDLIFSSPFIRTLQTIRPYLKKTNKMANIEYSLSEIHHEDIIPKKAYGMYLPEYLAEAFNYDKTYNSLIKPTDIKYPEKFQDVEKRLKKFLKELFITYFNTDKSIILVTHQSLCSSILKIVNKKEKIDEELITNYPTGQLSLVYSGDWTYKRINS
jgi:2,3-bisphosphoglycerate-dependent phosphoglycerate mutase